MKLQKRLKVISALAVAGIFAPLSDAKPAAAFGLVGLEDNGNNLVRFDSSNPSASTIVPITGVNGRILGIDLRPANNTIYGLSDTNNIYTINSFTGAASFVSTLSVPFTGGFVSGVDFNPVPDRLRVVGGNNQNFRINVDTGAVIVDGSLNPGDPNVTAAAYTNADTDPITGTTLYDIDYIADALFIQNPPNAGTLQSVGSLGIDISDRGGFDIITVNGQNTAFGAFTTTDRDGSSLYQINLDTGAATKVGDIGGITGELAGLTTEPVPEPITILGSLAGGGVLAVLRRRYGRLKSVK